MQTEEMEGFAAKICLIVKGLSDTYAKQAQQLIN